MSDSKSGAKKLVIIGDSPIAEIAYEYFTHDSPYEVVSFAVEEEFRKTETLFDLPIVPFESLKTSHPPESHETFIAVGYTKLNRLRTRLYEDARAMGYHCASYISSKAFLWRNVTYGDNCFIFENNVIQPFVKIGNNVTIWSGNHIGHHSTIRDHNFIASHVVISGFVEVEESCFLGVNATVANNVTIKKDCLVGANAVILKNTEEARIYGSQMTKPKEFSSLDYFKI